MMKKILKLFMLLSIAVILVACGSDSSSNSNNKSGDKKDDEVYKIILGHVQPAESSHQKTSEKWKELVEEKSNGRIKVEIYPAGQLGDERALIEGLQMNTVQVAISGGVLPTIEPKFGVVDLPFIFDDPEDAHQKLNGELGQKLFDLLPKHGLKGLAWTEVGMRHLTNSVKPVRSAEDLKGLKIRTPENQVYLETFKSLGANATPIAFTELFTALEQKVVDGQENPINLIHSSKFYEVQKYLSLTGHFYGTGPLIMSLKFYESLPEDLQKVIDEASKETLEYQYKFIAEEEEKLLKELEEAGMEIIRDVDKESFRKLVEPVYKKFEQEIGKELLDLARK